MVIPTPFGQAEINYCQVLRAKDDDKVKRGVQVGLAMLI